MRKRFIRLLLIYFYVIVNSVSYASPLPSCSDKIPLDSLRAIGSINTVVPDDIASDLDPNDTSAGAIGDYLITDATYDKRNKRVELTAYTPNFSDKIQHMAINAIPMPDQHINSALEEIMLLSSDENVSRLVSDTFIRWYTTEFRSGSRRSIILGYSTEKIYGIGTKNVIGISHKLIKRNRINPLAFLHEIMHSYLDAHDAKISDELLDRMEGSLTLMRKRWVERKVKKRPGFRAHYILRAWQRQNFKGKDEYLTHTISKTGEKQSMIEDGTLFALGDNRFEISRLFPMLHTLESIIARYNNTEGTERIGSELAIGTGTYGIQFSNTTVDLVIVDESGDRVASVILCPLIKSDRRNYDNKSVFISWFGIDKVSLRKKYGFGQNLYIELIEILANMGYEKIYGVLRTGSEVFWENMQWRSSEKKIYILGENATKFYSEKPEGSNNPVSVTGLYEADIVSMKTSSSGAEEQMSFDLESQRNPLYNAWKALRYKNHKSRFLYALDAEKYYEFLSFADGLSDDNSEQAFIYYNLWVRGMRLEIAANTEDGAAELKAKADLCYKKMFDEIFKVVPDKNSESFMAMFDKKNGLAYLGDLFDEELKLELILRYSEREGLLHDTLVSLIKVMIKLPDLDRPERNERYENIVSSVMERISNGESFNSISKWMLNIENQNSHGRTRHSTMLITRLLKWVGGSIYGEVEHRVYAISGIKQENSVITMVRQAA